MNREQIRATQIIQQAKEVFLEAFPGATFDMLVVMQIAKMIATLRL